MEEVPFEDRTVPRVEIDWGRSFWWWYPISRAVQPAIRMSSLLTSVLALLLLRFGILHAVDWFKPSRAMRDLVTQLSEFRFSSLSTQTFPSVPSLGVDDIAFVTFAILWIALIGSLFGGVLARRAAVELGQRTIAPWIRSIQLVGSRAVSYLWAAGMHIVGAVALVAPIALLGWFAKLGSIPAVISGILLIAVCLPLIFAIGRILMSLIFCYPLSVCAISVEKKADAFEGFSRSNAYLFQRPVLTVVCVALLYLFGLVGAFLVNWTVQLGWGLIQQTFSATSGHAYPAVDTYLGAGDWIAKNLIFAFGFSYFWSASAGLYLVLRKCVDNTDLDEMDLMESEIEQNPPKIPTTSQPATKSAASGSGPSSSEAGGEPEKSEPSGGENGASQTSADDPN